jgi:hypothetical protein
MERPLHVCNVDYNCCALDKAARTQSISMVM